MVEPTARRVADLAWSNKVAYVVVDALVKMKALPSEHHNRAVEITMREIYDMLATQDRPVT